MKGVLTRYSRQQEDADGWIIYSWIQLPFCIANKFFSMQEQQFILCSWSHPELTHSLKANWQIFNVKAEEGSVLKSK